MAYIHYTSGTPGAQLITTGELRLKQKYLLRHSGRTTTYNVSALLLTLFSKFRRHMLEDFIHCLVNYLSDTCY